MVALGPNYVTQVKTKDGQDGYNAVQIGFGEKKSVKKPQLGHLKKAGFEQSIRWLKEIRVEDKDVAPGKQINLGDIFKVGDAVKVTGVSKGKGFQGGVRRHGFHGGPKTHGQSDRHRAPGSIGSGTTPGRVYKGKKMAGHMGVETVSARGLEVMGVDKDNNLLTIKGAVPGPIGGLVIVQKQGIIKGYTPPPEEKPSEEEAAESEKSDESNPSTDVFDREAQTESAQDHREEKENAS